jgi:hypothetical protein
MLNIRADSQLKIDIFSFFVEDVIFELQGLQVEFMDVVKEVEDDVLSVVVHRAHNEIRSSNQISELIEFVLIKFEDVGLFVLFVVSFSSEDKHSVEVEGDNSHSVLSNINGDIIVFLHALDVEHSPA